MQAFKALQNRLTSVHNILVEANLASEIKTLLFQVLHFLALKN